MAMSYFSESAAPRDFRISSTESDGHYKKCVLCYTVKKNFHCVDCVRSGNFVHSSMPYSDRFAEKQAKLLRLRANRKHILDRCEKLLANKIKKDSLITETKRAKDKIDLLRLAIEQRKNSISEKKKELAEIKKDNNELQLKLPRYQKRVMSLGKHAQQQCMELQVKVSSYTEQAEALAALRRSRIRQLIKYIFPVYMTYDKSDSIEDLEFLGDDMLDEPLNRCQLHIVAPWINADGDFSSVQSWVLQNKESSSSGGVGGGAGAGSVPHRVSGALGLAAQLVAQLAWTLDARLPHSMPLSEYCVWRVSASGAARRARRVHACCAALCVRSALPPPRALHALHALALAANTDHPALGRVESWMSSSLLAAAEAEVGCAGGGEGEVDGDRDEGDLDDAEPEHLHWPEAAELEELSSSPAQAHAAAAAAPLSHSLVSSAAASLANMWRGWTK